LFFSILSGNFLEQDSNGKGMSMESGKVLDFSFLVGGGIGINNFLLYLRIASSDHLLLRRQCPSGDLTLPQIPSSSHTVTSVGGPQEFEFDQGCKR
jgi:hypothetical protein